MKPILNTVTMRWHVKGVGSFAQKEDTLAAIAKRSKSRMIKVRVKPYMYEALVDAANERRMSISDKMHSPLAVGALQIYSNRR